jgi:hypothetical protein
VGEVKLSCKCTWSIGSVSVTALSKEQELLEIKMTGDETNVFQYDQRQDNEALNGPESARPKKARGPEACWSAWQTQ